MKPTWYIQRLSRMSPTEVARRLRDIARKRRWRRRQVEEAEKDPLAVPGDAPAFASLLPAHAREDVPTAARERLLRAADEVLDGRWRVFECARQDMMPAPDWFLDPRSGRRAPHDTYCFDVPHRDEAVVGNIKYVWELSRHHHITLLAAAYFLSGDKRYAEAAAAHLDSWWRANPFLSGVHWTSAIEVGLRLIAWVWVRRLLDDWTGAHDLFEGNRVFLRQLHHHQEFLARLPSHGSSANNHLLAEAAGQFAAACAFPWFPESAGWRAHAAAELAREIPRQTFADGLNRELATEYHGFVLEFCLAAALEGEAAGQPLGGGAWETLRRMFDALAAIVDARGRPPRQGDGDDGMGLLLDAPESDRWASLLATGAALFGACDWWPEIRREDARTPLWTGLAQVPALAAPRPAARPNLFPEAGMAILRHGAGDDEIWCRCDHGPHGFLAIAAHGHADALSVEVRVGGIDVLADPGTYCYHGQADWRRYFRSTLGHNCLEIAGRDQSEYGGPFLWMQQARAELIGTEGLEGGPFAEWEARHDGYAKLSPPAAHRRTVRLERATKRLVIEDRVGCRGRHPCRLAFHLGPDIGCALEGSIARLEWRADGTRRHAELHLPAALSWRSVRAQDDPPLGWYSPSFDHKVPATSLVGAGVIGGDVALTTELRLAVDGGGKTTDASARENADAVS